MELIESFNNFNNFISYFSSSNKQELALEFILRFVLLLLLDSIIVFCRCNNRIRATVKILCSNCWSIWQNIRFLWRNNKNWDRGEKNPYKKIVLEIEELIWNFICHCKFKHCTYLFLSLFLSLHHLFELDFDRILNFKGILEKIFIYLYKLKI